MIKNSGQVKLLLTTFRHTMFHEPEMVKGAVILMTLQHSALSSLVFISSSVRIFFLFQADMCLLTYADGGMH